MNKIKLTLSLCFLTNFVSTYPFFNRYKKPLVLGGITSLAGVSVFKICEQLKKEECKRQEKEQMRILLQDPLVQRVIKTGNPCLIVLVGELKKRERDRINIFSLNDIKNNELSFCNKDDLKRKLEAIGLSHFVEKTKIINKLTVGEQFTREDLNFLLDESLDTYFKYLSSLPEAWQRDLKQIMQQRKEHILEVIVSSASMK